jgi:hypothetical protein
VINYSYILGALAIGCLLGYGFARYRSHSFQNRGESLVSREIQAKFGSSDYHLLNHITLKLHDGTTQVDHILVSRFGVFVIETKDYKGWIFANAQHAQWTQVLFQARFRFQNPLVQNQLHLKALQELLDFLPSDAFQSLVVFAGEAEFKTDKPKGVFSIPELLDHLRGCNEEVMTTNRMQFCVGRLETARLAVTSQTDLDHVSYLRQRYGNRA